MDSPYSNILTLPDVVKYLDVDTLKVFILVSKESARHVDSKNDSIGYWYAICRSFAYEKGLYMPSTDGSGINVLKNPRKYFFDELYVARFKWVTDSSTATDGCLHEFKIKVGCRFRPGVRGNQNMCLPLHQFLRVKREANAKAAKAKQGHNLLLGEEDPIEFVDPFLGSLMRDPVLLESSGKICDRVLASQCILRGGKDPFNGNKLTREMLTPQPELAEKIAAWRAKKASVDISVGASEVKSLIAEGVVDPELLEALLEAERLDHIAKRAQIDASISHQNWGTEYDASAGPHPQDAIVTVTDDVSQVPSPDELVLDDGLGAEALTEQPEGRGVLNDERQGHNDDGGSRFGKNGDTARVIDVNEDKGCVSMHVPGMGVRPFHFSNLYDGHASQQTVFDTSASDSITAALNGFNACVLCYGQTGSGKTHTSFGPEGALDVEIKSVDDVPSTAGIVVRACAQLLTAKDDLAKNGVFVTLSAQFVEIYDEQITDLLTGKTVGIRRESGELVGASEAFIDDGMQSVMTVLRKGHERKRFAATAMNDRSSRSHTAFIVQITQTCSEVPSTVGPESASSKLVKSQLHLVDLAGSERVKKSKAAGMRLREAVGINSSLLVLGKVIAGLVESSHHVPYLESKLTTMLRGAFGGNSRTTAIVACRSDDSHGEETLQSMRFGERCGMISNSTKMAATSLESAVQAIDAALTRVSEQVASLERRGKTHLDSYQKLAASLTHLQRKRDDLVKSAPPAVIKVLS